jgi:AcrR family transcriptional regulator
MWSVSMKSSQAAVEQGDLRVRRTHKLLWDALVAELSERPFEEITVKDICARAMVHRTTFYKHYEDKYALLERGMRRIFDDLVTEEEHRPPSAYSLDDPPPYFIRLFEHAAQHQQFYRLMLCGEGIGTFQRLVKEYIADVVEAKMRELPPAPQRLAVPPAMHAQFVAGATISLLAWWLENGMPLTPRQMAQYLLSPHSALPSPS